MGALSGIAIMCDLGTDRDKRPSAIMRIVLTA
jgi:hypothetical protein